MADVGCLFEKAEAVIVASDELFFLYSFAQYLVHYEQL